ncbi:MAG: DUF814 domain-containing protein [Candidatus Krumholzibacteriota bacterium]|nr:DUF814 domain-containing protein [Candidatus Krumholzibacteriota bacterium]
MTAYAAGIEFDALLRGSSIVRIARFAGGFTIELDGAPRPCLHILRYGRTTELVPGDRPLAGPGAASEPLRRLDNSRIERVEAVGLERILLFHLRGGTGWGEEEALTLRLDLTPAGKTLVLFGADGSALESLGSPKTAVPAAADETLPPKPLSILDLPADVPAAIAGACVPDGPASLPGHTRAWHAARAVAAALVAGVGGVDPVLARALADCRNGDPALVWEDLRLIGDALVSGERRWRIYDFPASGEAGIHTVYPVELPVPEPGREATDVLDALAGRGAAVLLPAFTDALREQAVAAARRDLRRQERLEENLDRDLAEAQRAGEHRRAGDLLVTHRHRMKPGMSSITVRDFSGTRDVTIPLDPARSPDANIRGYFTKAKKGEKGAIVIRNRRGEVRREVASLRKRLDRIENATGLEELLGMVRPARLARAGRAPAGRRGSFRRFRLDDRHTVLVGRTDRENDELTHRVAAPGDLWFHAQGVAGSHVVLRGATPSTPKRVIERAAAIAAWFSKARNATTVPVLYTEKRYVRKPRKAAPGTAVTLRHKTIFVEPAQPADDEATPNGAD